MMFCKKGIIKSQNSLENTSVWIGSFEGRWGFCKLKHKFLAVPNNEVKC